MNTINSHPYLRKKPAKRKPHIFHSVAKEISLHLRRGLVIIIIYSVGPLVIDCIGWLNRKFKFLKTVFVMYPAAEKYALALVYRSWLEKKRWQPTPVMFFRQNQKWGIGFAISATEEIIRSNQPETRENLKILLGRTERLRQRLGAECIAFSGVLPGIFARQQIQHFSNEAKVTVKAVTLGIKRIIQDECLPKTTPVIVIGGAGFIGSQLVQTLVNQNYQVYSIDTKFHENEIPKNLQNEPSIIVNASNREALKDYHSQLWSSAIWFNEVYPEPSKAEIAALTELGVRAYHMVGVQAKAFPPFPGAYRGGIPCCAAFEDQDMEVLVRKLN